MFSKLAKRIKTDKEREKIEMEYVREYYDLADKQSEAFNRYNEMLQVNNKIKIIKGPEAEKEFGDFMCSLKEKRYCTRLGSLWSMEKPVFIKDKNEVVIIIEYTIFELKSGIELKNYEECYNEYENYCLKIEELDKDRQKRIREINQENL